MMKPEAASALQNIRVVLARPSHPGNIGSAARAMKTMGLTRLTLVAPRDFPSTEAVTLVQAQQFFAPGMKALGVLTGDISLCLAVDGLHVGRAQIDRQRILGLRCGHHCLAAGVKRFLALDEVAACLPTFGRALDHGEFLGHVEGQEVNRTINRTQSSLMRDLLPRLGEQVVLVFNKPVLTDAQLDPGREILPHPQEVMQQPCIHELRGLPADFARGHGHQGRGVHCTPP